ncbi:hypothetical protein F384_15370 [Citrobacter amalonaticus Y19]|uniref:Uncharacterized protein n=1 Tax=Citrobacter amalonaticus Y19 TaxID=1261127 RepID=A0A0F6RFZ9_CITAM|nr:hypothetical protein F384_15370 [Citrobacter amalonaticus Y19]
MVAMTVPIVGKRLHSVSVTENVCWFKQIACYDAANVSNTLGIKTKIERCKPLVTLCEGLLRLFAGDVSWRLDKVEIPEVLIGEVNFRVEHTNYTNLRQLRRFFFAISAICNSKR